MAKVCRESYLTLDKHYCNRIKKKRRPTMGLATTTAPLRATTTTTVGWLPWFSATALRHYPFLAQAAPPPRHCAWRRRSLMQRKEKAVVTGFSTTSSKFVSIVRRLGWLVRETTGFRLVRTSEE
jgi:hypothetical protein